MIENASEFSDDILESILATAARFLVKDKHVASASLLANSYGSIKRWNHDNWNGGQDTWRLTLRLPAEVYFDLADRETIEGQIASALTTAVQAFSESDFFDTKLVAALDRDPDWRRKVTQHLSGEGITNQGRVRSDNIAAREHEGLLFRSLPEILFYDALKRTGLPFAPLSVVVRGGEQRRRVEPDFVILKSGLIMVVEIDGDLFHTETPAAAHARLKFLLDEGAKLERINASECDTQQKAREAVARVVATMDKLRQAR